MEIKLIVINSQGIRNEYFTHGNAIPHVGDTLSVSTLSGTVRARITFIDMLYSIPDGKHVCTIEASIPAL